MITTNKIDRMHDVGTDSLSVQSELYGKFQGKEIYTITLQNSNVKVVATNLGCNITAIYTPGRNGEWKNIVAGFEHLEDYGVNRDYFGCVLGRYANRIGGGRFRLNGHDVKLSLNDGINHLHGGVEGFS